MICLMKLNLNMSRSEVKKQGVQNPNQPSKDCHAEFPLWEALLFNFRQAPNFVNGRRRILVVLIKNTSIDFSGLSLMRQYFSS